MSAPIRWAWYFEAITMALSSGTGVSLRGTTSSSSLRIMGYTSPSPSSGESMNSVYSAVDCRVCRMYFPDVPTSKTVSPPMRVSKVSDSSSSASCITAATSYTSPARTSRLFCRPSPTSSPFFCTGKYCSESRDTSFFISSQSSDFMVHTPMVASISRLRRYAKSISDETW